MTAAEKAETLSTLRSGEMEILARMPWSSNHTFLVTAGLSGRSLSGIYKPLAGERPLWDFDPGLGRREAAAYELSEELNWGFIPPTVWREEAPLGPGSIQLFVEADFQEHYFTICDQPDHLEAIEAICAFDVIANNADRKAGHVLVGSGGKLWGIDHGLCFHRQPKLRTVIWELAGQELPERLLGDLERIAALESSLTRKLDSLLAPGEIAAISDRAAWLVRNGAYPIPDPETHHYPWPLV